MMMKSPSAKHPLVADRRLQLRAVGVDPLPEIECLQGLHCESVLTSPCLSRMLRAARQLRGACRMGDRVETHAARARAAGAGAGCRRGCLQCTGRGITRRRPPPRRCTSSTSAVRSTALPAVLEAQYAAGRSERAPAVRAASCSSPRPGQPGRCASRSASRPGRSARSRCAARAARGCRSRPGGKPVDLELAPGVYTPQTRADDRVVGTGGRARSLRPRGSLRLRRRTGRW